MNRGRGEASSGERQPLGVSVYHLCTIFQVEVILYANETFKPDTSFDWTVYGINNELKKIGKGFIICLRTNNKHNWYNINHCNSYSSNNGNNATLLSGLYIKMLLGCNHVGEVMHMLSYF